MICYKFTAKSPREGIMKISWRRVTNLLVRIQQHLFSVAIAELTCGHHVGSL